MPGRRGWSSDRDGPPPIEPADHSQQRAAARTVAAASTDLDDLRELLAMLGLDDLNAASPTSPATLSGLD